MPISSYNLGPDKPYMLDEIKACVRLDVTSPSGIAWREEYKGRGARPGRPAGNMDTRGYAYIVTLKGYPLYCRHVVWMLTNNSMIPDNMDVCHADRDVRNLLPPNLKLIPKGEKLTPTQMARKLGTHKAFKNDVRNTQPNRFFINSSNNPEGMFHNACIGLAYKPKEARVIGGGNNIEVVQSFGIRAAQCFGYLPDVGPPVVKNPSYDVYVTAACAAIYKPPAFMLNLEQRRTVVQYLTSLFEVLGKPLSQRLIDHVMLAPNIADYSSKPPDGTNA